MSPDIKREVGQPENNLPKRSLFNKPMTRRAIVATGTAGLFVAGVLGASRVRDIIFGAGSAVAGEPEPSTTPSATPETKVILPIVKAKSTGTPTVAPTATVQPTGTPTEIPKPTVSTTATKIISPTPSLSREASPTPDALAEAPDIPGLRKERKDGKITYIAESGNKWGLKEGELAGKVVKFTEVNQSAPEQTLGLVLHDQITTDFFLSHNTEERIAAGNWQVPLPFSTDAGFVLTEKQGRLVKFLGVNFNNPSDIIGLAIKTNYPGNSQATGYPNCVAIEIPLRYSPDRTTQCYLAFYSDRFSTPLPNAARPVSYGQTLMTITSPDTMRTSSSFKDFQLTLTIGTKDSKGRNFTRGNILNYRGHYLFMR